MAFFNFRICQTFSRRRIIGVYKDWKFSVDSTYMNSVTLLSFFLDVRVSQPQHIGTRSFSVVGAVLCMAGYLAAALASTFQMPVAPSLQVMTIKNAYRQCQMSPGGEQNHAPPGLTSLLKVKKKIFLIKVSKGQDHL